MPSKPVQSKTTAPEPAGVAAKKLAKPRTVKSPDPAADPVAVAVEAVAVVPAAEQKPATKPALRPVKAVKPDAEPPFVVAQSAEPEAEPVEPAPVVVSASVVVPTSAVVLAPVVVPAPVAVKPAPEPQFRSPPKMPGHMPGMHGRPQIAPRAMAAKEDFAEGDFVVYPTHGVGKVERIATEEIAGHKLELIHITFEENRMTLRVPVAKARTAGLRKLATRIMFDKALALMKGRARIKRTMWSRRAQEYEQKINSGDPMQIAEVVRDLYRNAGQPDQSFSERQIYENAMDRLAAEYAALEKTDKATAMQRLVDDLKTVVKGAAIEVDAEGEEVETVE